MIINKYILNNILYYHGLRLLYDLLLGQTLFQVVVAKQVSNRYIIEYIVKMIYYILINKINSHMYFTND